MQVTASRRPSQPSPGAWCEFQRQPGPRCAPRGGERRRGSQSSRSASRERELQLGQLAPVAAAPPAPGSQRPRPRPPQASASRGPAGCVRRLLAALALVGAVASLLATAPVARAVASLQPEATSQPYAGQRASTQTSTSQPARLSPKDKLDKQPQQPQMHRPRAGDGRASRTTIPRPQQQPAAARQPRVYHIRAAPVNGRLGPPLRLEQLAGHLEPLDGPPTRTANQSDGWPAPQFGARASPAANLRQLNLQHQARLASKTPAASGEQRGQQLQAATAANCNNQSVNFDSQARVDGVAVASQRHQSSNSGSKNYNNNNDNNNISNNNSLDAQSIAASSPTLRLIAPGRGGAPAAAGTHEGRAPAPLPAHEIDESEADAHSPKAPPSGHSDAADESPESRQEASDTDTNKQLAQQVPNLIDEFDSKMITNMAKAQLSCDSGEIILRLNFTEPFRGIVYPDNNRLSPCRFFGDGHHNYELRLPLRGCGTRQVSPRTFVNDVIVRFHKTLELEEDEVKTLICRYPPPLALQAQPFGHGLLHELEPTTATPSVAGHQNHRRPGGVQQFESPFNGQQPFELVDPIGGHSSRGQIESLGGQLLSSRVGQQLDRKSTSTFSGQLHDYSTKTISQHQVDDQQQLQPFSRQKNANIINSGGIDLSPSSGGAIGRINGLPTGDNAPQRGTGLLDRLTSIELLFLISALMFLVLLGLGLMAAYYCFRRRPRSAAARAGAILRKGRYLNPSSGLTAAPRRLNRAPTTVLHHHSRAPSETLASGLYRPNQAAQYYGLRPSVASQTFYGHPQQQPMTEPSSPESDQSSGHRVLLPAVKSYHRLASEHKQLKQQQYDQPNIVGTIKTQPVVGRRGDASTYAPVAPIGRANQQCLQTQYYQTGGRRHQRPTTSMGHRQQIFGPTKDESNTLSRHVVTSARQPLLQLVSTIPDDLEYQNNSVDRLSGSQNGRFKNENLRVSRTRSMQQLSGLKPADLGGFQSLSRRQLSNCHPDGKEFVGGGRRASGKPRQIMIKQGSILKPRPLNQSNAHHFDHSMHQSIDDNEPQVTSDSETELYASNNNHELWKAQDESNRITNELQKPRLYLKSIEDSFITNVTEIHEQEYIKEDSKKILDWAQWRARQPIPSDKPTKREKNNPNTSRKNNDDEDDEYQSNQANLRSLTELDVDFAKSLLLNPEATIDKKSSAANISTSKGPVEKSDNVDRSKQAGQKNDNKESPLTTSDDTQTSNNDNSTTRQTQSPDLIISQEYDCDSSNRHKLTSSPTSHDSVSYV